MQCWEMQASGLVPAALLGQGRPELDSCPERTASFRLTRWSLRTEDASEPARICMSSLEPHWQQLPGSKKPQWVEKVPQRSGVLHLIPHVGIGGDGGRGYVESTGDGGGGGREQPGEVSGIG